MSYIILKYIDFYYIFIIKLMVVSICAPLVYVTQSGQIIPSGYTSSNLPQVAQGDKIYAPLVYVTQSGQIIPSGLGTPKNLTQVLLLRVNN